LRERLQQLLAALCLCVSGGRASAQLAPPVMRDVDALHWPGRDVTVSLLTIGDGDLIWQMFGHSAIWIHNDVTGRDTVFNWGAFDFSQPHFILHFLQGLNLYRMDGATVRETVDAERRRNRTVRSQELELTVAQKDSLLEIIRVNARPENISYRYDYFRDNCATRPRDMIDRVLGGQLHAQSGQVTDRSYRWHALNQMQGNKPLVLGVDIALGAPSDRPITRWAEMFLPRELHDVVATTQVRDSTGSLRPLARSNRVLFQSTRPPEPTLPPNLAPPLLVIGLVIGALFLVLGLRAPDGGTAIRIATAVIFAVWSLVAGLLGVVLTLLWVATDHVFAHRNMNLLLFNPLWLALVVMLPLMLMTGRGSRATKILATVLGSLCAAALVARIAGVSTQSNLAIVGLALPPAAAIAMTARRWRARLTLSRE
jgi:hypothetical protein